MINSIPPQNGYNQFHNSGMNGASKLLGFDVDNYIFGKDLSSKNPDNPMQNASVANNSAQNPKKKESSLAGALLLTGIIAGTAALIISLRGKIPSFSELLNKIKNRGA